MERATGGDLISIATIILLYFPIRRLLDARRPADYTIARDCALAYLLVTKRTFLYVIVVVFQPCSSAFILVWKKTSLCI